MNTAFDEVISSSAADRGALFAETAARLGTAVQNVEKDFWVCWTLDALFNGLDAGSPRLLFKGGTSLSKAFTLISRFSEDIDITVFREDIGQTVDAAALDALSGKQRRGRLDAIRDACQTYINGPLTIQRAKRAEAVGNGRMKLEPDPDDADKQTLLLWYPTATARGDDYIRSAVKIEAGAKSALDPHTAVSIQPLIAPGLPHLDLRVSNVVTVQAERTFWDKMIILHGLRQWYERRGVLRHAGNACPATTTTFTSFCAMNRRWAGWKTVPWGPIVQRMRGCSLVVPIWVWTPQHLAPSHSFPRQPCVRPCKPTTPPWRG